MTEEVALPAAADTPARRQRRKIDDAEAAAGPERMREVGRQAQARAKRIRELGGKLQTAAAAFNAASFPHRLSR
jgi:hypothetical protein